MNKLTANVGQNCVEVGERDSMKHLKKDNRMRYFCLFFILFFFFLLLFFFFFFFIQLETVDDDDRDDLFYVPFNIN